MRRFSAIIAAIIVATSVGKIKSEPTTYLSFNGVDQYIDIPTTDDLKVTSSQSLSVSFWVKADNASAMPRVFSNRYNMSNTYGCLDVFYGTSGCAVMFISTDGDDPINNYLGGSAGEWTHVAAVFNRADGSVQAYANGVEISLSDRVLDTTDIINTIANTIVGATTSSTGDIDFYLEGAVANMRYYRGALTKAQVTTDMNTNSYSSLSTELKDICTAAYDFDNSYTSLTLTDATGRGNDGELINFEDPNAEPGITSVILTQNSNLTGRKNEQDVIIQSTITVAGGSTTLNAMSINLDGTTDISDINKIRVYSTGGTSTFEERYITDNATLIGEFSPSNRTMTCTLTPSTLSRGTNYIWLTVDVSEDATEGNKIDASVFSFTTEDEYYEVEEPSPEGDREILLAAKTIQIYADYTDGEIHTYRIPAMDILPNGNLVIAYDVRPYPTEYDLPNDISVYSRISEDGGYTWSDPAVVALGGGTESTGRGDAAVVALNNDTIFAAFAGDNGLSASTTSDPISQYITHSYDGGKTWAEIVKGGTGDYTDLVFSVLASGEETAFFSSGKGLVLKRQTGDNAYLNGRIMFVTAAGRPLDNYIVYSDDKGATWNISEQAYSGGDEAKVTELNDGTVIISVRKTNSRGYNHSTDGGETWGTQGDWDELVVNACNGDIMEYTTEGDGYSINRTLHSLPTNDGNGAREKITMYISYDEGDTWQNGRQIFDGYSAYSTMVKFDDGTVGLFVERGEMGTTLLFLRFTLNWLTNGTDTYTAPYSSVVERPTFTPESNTEIEEGGSITVTINCATEGSKIYYTLDGTTPTVDNGIVYSETIVISGGTTIMAIGVAEGYEDSALATANYPTKDYCTTSLVTASTRYIEDITLNGGVSSFTISDVETGSGRNVYSNLTENVFVAEAGATITPVINWSGNWMHGYLYIDYNNDLAFTPSLADDGTPTSDSELVSFTYYETNGSDGVNSDGDSLNDYTDLPISTMPSFTLPQDIEGGDYRIRFKVDWNSIDPCGENSSISANGGSIVDFTLRINSTTGIEGIDSNNTKIVSGKGYIKIDTPLPTEVKIYNTKGEIVKSSIIYNQESIMLPSGIYLVDINNKTTKTIVQ